MTVPGALPLVPRAASVRGRRKPVGSASTGVLSDPFRLCLMALIVFSLSRLGGYFGILRLLRPALLRSEEHTSELQSHSDLVCRLLLEKKKNLLTTLNDPNW